MFVPLVKTPCCFCDVNPDLVVKSFNDFVVLMDPYPVCAGHFMIASRDHWGCVGELDGSLLDTLTDIYQELKTIIVSLFGCCAIYEHGRAGSCFSASEQGECNHMHVHLLAANCQIHPALSERFVSKECPALISLSENFHAYGEYLYFQGSGALGRCYLARGAVVPPHLLRTLVAGEMGCPGLGDWGNYDNQEMIERNIAFKRKVAALI